MKTTSPTIRTDARHLKRVAQARLAYDDRTTAQAIACGLTAEFKPMREHFILNPKK
jgi:hypothetical protein